MTLDEYDKRMSGLDLIRGLLIRSRLDELNIIEIGLRPALENAASAMGLPDDWQPWELDQAIASLKDAALADVTVCDE